MIKIFFIFLLLFLFSIPVHAQNKPIEFITTSYANLTKLYAGLNAFDWQNPQIIDSYLRITECDLFKKYARNEFEWNKLRTAMGGHLTQYKSQLPSYMEFVLPISLQAYDFNLNGFNFSPENKIQSTTRLIVSTNSKSNISSCAAGSIYVVSAHFPLNMVLSFEKPFELSFITVPQEVAEKYLIFIGRNKNSQQIERSAFLRIRFRAERWQPLLKDGSETLAHMYGALVSVDVFADKELTLPLFSKKL